MMYHASGLGIASYLIAFGILLPTLVLVGGLLLARLSTTPSTFASPESPPEAERILASRLARGEIDSEDYEQRLSTLRAARR
jgi:putative membrane protein